LKTNPNSNKSRQLGFYALILVILLGTVYYMAAEPKTPDVTYSEVVDLFKQEKVESFRTEGSTLILSLREEYNGSKTITKELASFDIFYNDLGDLIKAQKDAGILTEYTYEPAWAAPWWLSFLPYVGILVIFGVIWYSMMNRAGGAGTGGVAKFSKARTRLGSEEKKKVTFADVAGAEEEKAELQEGVSFLQIPKHTRKERASPRAYCW
jgi:cell division protease FtsH